MGDVQEWWTDKDFHGHGRGLFQDNIPVYAWKCDKIYENLSYNSL
jgi:hypothetical protein